MKVKKKSNPAPTNQLYEAILTLRNEQECEAFFRDLCTPAELQALTDRWLVAQMLNDGLSYRAVAEKADVSITTVTRVARFLHIGNNGYTEALKRLHRLPNA